jgi:hypothetical protein
MVPEAIMRSRCSQKCGNLGRVVERSMTGPIKKRHPALKHAGYSTTGILPGESAAEFGKLHQELICELTPNGALEDEIVAAMAHLLWRRKNLAIFRIAEFAQQHITQIRGAMVPGMDQAVPKSDETVEFERTFNEKWHAAESQGRKELGDLYALVEMGGEVTVDHLMKDLEVQDRLDGMIDKCLKRLLFLRGLKSISSAPAAAPGKPITGALESYVRGR